MGVLLNPNVKHENSNLQKKLLFSFSWIPSNFLSALRVRQRGLVLNKSQYNSFCGRWTCTTWDCKALFFRICPWHGWHDSVSQEHTKVVYCTYVLNAATKSMAKAYHDKCQSKKSKTRQCLLRASKHHNWVYLLPSAIRQE